MKWKKWEKEWIRHEDKVWGYRHDHLMYQLSFIQDLLDEIKEKILKEVEKEIKEVENDLNKTYRRKPKNRKEFILKAFSSPAGEYAEGYLKGLKFTCEKIQKAFRAFLWR